MSFSCRHNDRRWGSLQPAHTLGFRLVPLTKYHLRLVTLDSLVFWLVRHRVTSHIMSAGETGVGIDVVEGERQEGQHLRDVSVHFSGGVVVKS